MNIKMQCLWLAMLFAALCAVVVSTVEGDGALERMIETTYGDAPEATSTSSVMKKGLQAALKRKTGNNNDGEHEGRDGDEQEDSNEGENEDSDDGEKEDSDNLRTKVRQ